ncbi:MAG: hypothetical protein ABW164_05040 [Sphingobium sp.]
MRTHTALKAKPLSSFLHGYLPLYRDDEPNRCPGCGGQQWIIGRMTAECGMCASAIPLEKFSTWSAAPRVECRGPATGELPDYLKVVV